MSVWRGEKKKKLTSDLFDLLSCVLKHLIPFLLVFLNIQRSGILGLLVFWDFDLIHGEECRKGL